MKRYGLIGKTLSHSFSKSFFNEEFRRLKIADTFSYQNYELNSISGLNALIASDDQLFGLNVTFPYKQEVIPLLNSISDIAKDISAVNTISIQRDDENNLISLTGYNTDGPGFLQAVEPLLQNHHRSALILGTGGASKAVAWALKHLNISFLFVSRNAEVGHLRFDDLSQDILKQYPVIVNTTPLGNFPDINESPPIPYHYLNEKNLLFDLVYNPAETCFMNQGRERGAVVSNGFTMLIHQAKEAWKIWNLPDTALPEFNR